MFRQGKQKNRKWHRQRGRLGRVSKISLIRAKTPLSKTEDLSAETEEENFNDNIEIRNSFPEFWIFDSIEDFKGYFILSYTKTLLIDYREKPSGSRKHPECLICSL